MPKSKVRKKKDFTVSAVSRTPVKVKAGPSSMWFVALFVGLMLIGLIWLMVFQLAAAGSQTPRCSPGCQISDRGTTPSRLLS
ncbi:hypothetical protein I553_8715 [Mycobacterium xenopi 4042]|uniref:Uncharacterized protein n=1 Tax=Mycobacterium xenopi 4042 TaxID=1299334 RepID=X8CMH9_MYCXE|nr:hypothetical protein I553_8715 [Mycobacterium xenopi 4042]